MKESTAQLPWQENGDEPANTTLIYNKTTGKPCGQYLGLTKREKFAMAAMQGILSRTANGNHLHIITNAIELADELLKQLSDGE